MTLEDSELLTHLTIVIPTCNRPLELERVIEYWRDTPVTVHILDGSDKPWFAVGTIFGVPNITYHYFPPADSEIASANFKKRLQFATRLPKTEFSALIGDEDFFTISGLCACLRILFEDNKICSVIGVTAGFKTQVSETKWGLREAQKLSSKDFESMSVKVRLKPTQSGEIPILYYGIYRTDTWVKTITLSFRHDFRTRLIGGERLLHTIALALGPMKEIQNILWLRRFWLERTTFEHFSPQRGDSDRYLLDKANQTEVSEYYAILAEAINEGVSGLGKTGALKLSKKVLKPNFKSAQSGLKYQLRKKLARALVRVGSIFSPRLRLSLNRMMGNTITKSLGFVEIRENWNPAHGRLDLDTFLKRLAKTEISYDEAELRRIERLLLMPRSELRVRANI